jgi:hypothetical protein
MALQIGWLHGGANWQECATAREVRFEVAPQAIVQDTPKMTPCVRGVVRSPLAS